MNYRKYSKAPKILLTSLALAAGAVSLGACTGEDEVKRAPQTAGVYDEDSYVYPHKKSDDRFELTCDPLSPDTLRIGIEEGGSFEGDRTIYRLNDPVCADNGRVDRGDNITSAVIQAVKEHNALEF